MYQHAVNVASEKIKHPVKFSQFVSNNKMPTQPFSVILVIKKSFHKHSTQGIYFPELYNEKKNIVKIKFPFYIIFKYNSTINGDVYSGGSYLTPHSERATTTTNIYIPIECEDINIYSLTNKNFRLRLLKIFFFPSFCSFATLCINFLSSIYNQQNILK